MAVETDAQPSELCFRTALIVGAGAGLSAALARRLSSLGVIVSLAARNVEKLESIAAEADARTYAVDASEEAGISALFNQVNADTGDPDIVIYNAALPCHGALGELDPEAVR